MVRNATCPKPEVLGKNHRKKLFLQKTECSSESPKHPEWFVFLNHYHKWFLGFLGKLRKILGEYSDLPCNSRVDELAAWIHTHTHKYLCICTFMCILHQRDDSYSHRDQHCHSSHWNQTSDPSLTTASTHKTAPIADASTNRVFRAVNEYTELENVSIWTMHLSQTD